MNIDEARATDLTDTDGAAKILAERFGRPQYSIESVKQLVKQNRLRSFLFLDGRLVERSADVSTRGKDLIFLASDLYELPLPRPVGRPSAKN